VYRNKSRYKKRFYKSKGLYSIKESNQCFLGAAAFFAFFAFLATGFLAPAFLVTFLVAAFLAVWTLGALVATFFAAAARAIEN
jgi:hypothetical protein